MAVGFPFGKADIDSRVGQLALTLRNTLRDVEVLRSRLDDLTDSDLQTLGYTPAEVTLLKDSVIAMSKLARIARGADTQPAASDFFFVSRKLLGLN